MEISGNNYTDYKTHVEGLINSIIKLQNTISKDRYSYIRDKIQMIKGYLPKYTDFSENTKGKNKKNAGRGAKYMKGLVDIINELSTGSTILSQSKKTEYLNRINVVVNDLKTLLYIESGRTVANDECDKAYIWQVADIYPAYNLVITVLALIGIYPNLGDDRPTPQNYLKMIASFVLFVNLFNTFCGIKMNSSWNTSISNKYVYEIVNVPQKTDNRPDIDFQSLEPMEADALDKHIDAIEDFHAGSGVNIRRLLSFKNKDAYKKILDDYFSEFTSVLNFKQFDGSTPTRAELAILENAASEKYKEAKNNLNLILEQLNNTYNMTPAERSAQEKEFKNMELLKIFANVVCQYCIFYDCEIGLREKSPIRLDNISKNQTLPTSIVKTNPRQPPKSNPSTSFLSGIKKSITAPFRYLGHYFSNNQPVQPQTGFSIPAPKPSGQSIFDFTMSHTPKQPVRQPDQQPVRQPADKTHHVWSLETEDEIRRMRDYAGDHPDVVLNESKYVENEYEDGAPSSSSYSNNEPQGGYNNEIYLRSSEKADHNYEEEIRKMEERKERIVNGQGIGNIQEMINKRTLEENKKAFEERKEKNKLEDKKNPWRNEEDLFLERCVMCFNLDEIN